MSEPIIQANRSLVLNGDFIQGKDNWIHKGLVTTGEENYEGDRIKLVNITNGASLSQDLVIPKTPGTEAQYKLSFLAQTVHEEPALLIISKGTLTLAEIELKPAPTFNLEYAREQRDAGQPLDFRPIESKLSLDYEGLEGGDTLSIEFRSPKNQQGDDYSKLRIARVNLQLHLAALELQSVQLDEQTLDPGSTVYLCLGASLGGEQGDGTRYVPHQLSVKPLDDNAWLGTQMALTSVGNPLDAVKARPDWGVEQSVTSAWLLDCPVPGEDRSYNFSINLINEYNVAPWSINVSLGHHRVAIREVHEAAYYPVLEYAQSVRLGLQVTSFYTGQPLPGRTVTWMVPGLDEPFIGTSNEQGWAYFDFTPKTAGDVVIKASVDSPYYAAGVATSNFDVKVLATDPWKDLRAVVDGGETPWEACGYPNRGSDYSLGVRLPADSPMAGADLSLHWSGDGHEQLGVTVNPALTEPVPFDGNDMTWTLGCEDRLNGRFAVALVCSKLLLPSPDKPMSLARNRIRVGKVQEANKFPIVDETESVLLRVQAVHELDLGDGDSVIGALVDWMTPDGESVRNVTGADGWASLLYAPQTAGDLTVTARVRAHQDAVSVERDFAVKAYATSPWQGEVDILLDGEEVDRKQLGVLCRRGKTHTLKVLPRVDSEWVGKYVSLQWRDADPEIGLIPADLGTPKPLVASGVEWVLTSDKANSVSSLFELELRLEGVDRVRELSGRLVSDDLTEDVALMLDQVHANLDDQPLHPCLGAVHTFNVIPGQLSALIGLDATLSWSGTPPESLGATVEPPLDHPQQLSDGGASWVVNFTQSREPGAFFLKVQMPQLAFSAVAKPMSLAHNKLRIEAWRESAVDPVLNQAPAKMWVQAFSQVLDCPVAEAKVSWTTEEGVQHIDSGADGWSGFDFAPGAPGLHTVTASLVSPFDGYEERQLMTINALDRDPWSDLMLIFDGQPPEAWGEKTCFPRRKGTHRLTVMAPRGSPLLDRQLTLGMTGTGPAALAIQFTPPVLGVPKLFSSAGYSYDFSVGDLADGSFAFCLASERLASLSPANAMSVGQGEQVVKIAERERINRTLLWGEQVSEQITVISMITGRPMSGVAVTWRSPDFGEMTSTTDFYGEARIRFVPVTPGAFELTATVGGTLHADSISLQFNLNEPREIQSLQSDEPSGHPGQEVSAWLIVICARTGEPLVDVEVEWEYPGIKIAPSTTDHAGKAVVRFRIPPIREGWLSATVKGGYAGSQVQSMGFIAKPNLDTWMQEFTLLLNGQEVDFDGEPLEVVRGVANKLELRVRSYSWLIPWEQVALEDHDGAVASGLQFSPDLEVLRPVDGNPLCWSVATSLPGTNREFSLKLTSPDIPDKVLAAKIVDASQQFEVLFDTFSHELGAATAYPCHGAIHTVRLRLIPGSPLSGSHVQLNWQGESAESLGVVVTPGLDVTHQLDGEWLTWTLDCKNSTRDAKFSLALMASDSNWTASPLAMSLGHNLVTVERWHKNYDGPIHYYDEYGIRATSSFLNTPAEGVEVVASRSHVPSPEITLTDQKGEVIRPVVDAVVYFSIKNRYDGTDV